MAAAHSREEAVEIIQSGHLEPEDEFTYRRYIANGGVKDFTHLERFMLSLYGRDYLDTPELCEFFYKDVEIKARNVGQLALFADTHTESGLSAVTIGILGNTEAYPKHVRLGAQSANFNNTRGLSGLTRVRLNEYQRVVLDQDGRVDLLRSVPTNTLRWNPFIVEHFKLFGDITTFMGRKDMRVGEAEIANWADTHPTWTTFVEDTLEAVRSGSTNPIIGFDIPKSTEEPRGLRAFEKMLDFERSDDM
jgi:hypothetical protein